MSEQGSLGEMSNEAVHEMPGIQRGKPGHNALIAQATADGTGIT